METIDKNFDNSQLLIPSRTKDFLFEAAKWAFFLSIVGFVGLGFMILGGLIIITAGFALTGASGDLGVLGIIYLIGAILYFFPTYYMFLFAKKTKSACVNNNQLDLDSGIENLKSLFKYVGIFTIVTIAIYLLMFILGSVAFGLA